MVSLSLAWLLDNAIWIGVLVASFWFLRYYVRFRGRANASQTAVRGLLLESRLASRRIQGLIMMGVGAAIVVITTLGLSVPALLTLDPTAWAPILAIGASVAKLMGVPVTTQTAIYGIVGGTIAVIVLRELTRRALAASADGGGDD